MPAVVLPPPWWETSDAAAATMKRKEKPRLITHEAADCFVHMGRLTFVTFVNFYCWRVPSTKQTHPFFSRNLGVWIKEAMDWTCPILWTHCQSKAASWRHVLTLHPHLETKSIMLLFLIPSQAACALLWFIIHLHGGDAVSTDVEAYGATSQSPYQTFISAPDLKPPELLISTNLGELANGYLFIGVDGKPESTQNVPCIYGLCSVDTRLELRFWPMLLDMSPGPRLGTLVWTGINYTQPFDFRVQTYKGKPHLTFFLGKLLDGWFKLAEMVKASGPNRWVLGYGHGSFYILNESYSEVAHFDAVGYPGRESPLITSIPILSRLSQICSCGSSWTPHHPGRSCGGHGLHAQADRLERTWWRIGWVDLWEHLSGNQPRH
jgi:hypothetical protein